MRPVRDSEMVGKTIKSISNKSCNVLTIYFTDETFIELWAEDAVHTPHGNIPGIFVNDDFYTDETK
jgi:hypothetical protein